VRTVTRNVALADGEVLGFRSMSEAVAASLPPLLSGAARSAVAQLGTLDRELIAVLDTASLVPHQVFLALDRTMVSA
jgi:hypothetical protein